MKTTVKIKSFIDLDVLLTHNIPDYIKFDSAKELMEFAITKKNEQTIYQTEIVKNILVSDGASFELKEGFNLEKNINVVENLSFTNVEFDEDAQEKTNKKSNFKLISLNQVNSDILNQKINLIGKNVLEIEIIEEREKAILVKVKFEEFSHILEDFRQNSTTFWLPKYAIMSVEDYEAKKEEKEARKNAGLERNLKLVEFGKANNVKGIRKGMKTITLEKKIEEAGLIINF